MSSVRSLLPKACLNIFRAVRALLSKPENCQLSLSYSDKASALLRDSLNLGPHCHSSSLDKVHTHPHTKAPECQGDFYHSYEGHFTKKTPTNR